MPLAAIGKLENEGESMNRLAEKMVRMKRYAYPNGAVGMAAFPASTKSDYMIGQLIMIGGMAMQ